MPRLLRAELEKADPKLARAFDHIYEESLRIWNTELHSKFTTHGQAHSEQVEANLGDLTRPLQHSEKPLNEHEIFVLLSGACLHDVGMQLIDDPDARANHAEAARQMILNSFNRVPSELRHITLPIEDDNAREAIANVARAHWVDYALPLPPNDYINGNHKGRLRLLGLLLAMADLLDLSSVRAHYFRSSHIFYRLDPMSELHHVKHKLVRGFGIGPPDERVRGSLRFNVEWREEEGDVITVNDWVIQSFNSQWRQIREALYEESGGAINWTRPWTNVEFRKWQDRPTKLPDHARKVLLAERAEQIRIDREAFASSFREALSKKETAVFLFPAESDFDQRWLSPWCAAYSRAHDGCHVASVDIRPMAVFDVASVVARIMDEWNTELPECSDEEALLHLQKFLNLHDEADFVTIIKTNEAADASLENLLEILMSRNSTAARVCLLITPKAKGPADIGAASIVYFDDSLLSLKEVEDYLQKKHGYSGPESIQFCLEMQRTLGLTAYPASVYHYIEVHCRC